MICCPTRPPHCRGPHEDAPYTEHHHHKPARTQCPRSPRRLRHNSTLSCSRLTGKSVSNAWSPRTRPNRATDVLGAIAHHRGRPTPEGTEPKVAIRAPPHTSQTWRPSLAGQCPASVHLVHSAFPSRVRRRRKRYRATCRSYSEGNQRSWRGHSRMARCCDDKQGTLAYRLANRHVAPDIIEHKVMEFYASSWRIW